MQNERRVDILLVDDRPQNLTALEALMEGLGARTVRAGSGQEALKRLLEQDFALILLDVQMPGMDGFETASLIRQRGRSQHTPIVFVTAFTIDEALVFKGYALGAVDFLFKPIVPEVLRSKVKVFVDLFNQTEEIRRQAEQLRQAEQKAHAHEMAAARRRWEADQLREQMEEEKRIAEQLEENYRRLQELETLRDELTHMIVHDLRSPLTALLMGLQSVELFGELNGGQAECLELALRGGQSLLGMINDLLDISKMEAGSPTLESGEIAAVELASSVVQQILPLAREKRQSVAVSIEEELPAFCGDAEKLTRTLVNLLSNAVKFTPPAGEITLEARLLPEEEAVLFTVRDTGEGIPEEAFGRIFEKFGQVETRQAGRKMSTGLGLTFCKMAVEAHGGRIWVESVVGQGSAFSFTVPRKGPSVPAPRKTPPRTREATCRLMKK